MVISKNQNNYVRMYDKSTIWFWCNKNEYCDDVYINITIDANMSNHLTTELRSQ